MKTCQSMRIFALAFLLSTYPQNWANTSNVLAQHVDQNNYQNPFHDHNDNHNHNHLHNHRELKHRIKAASPFDNSQPQKDDDFTMSTETTTRCHQKDPTAEEIRTSDDIYLKWQKRHPCYHYGRINPLCGNSSSERAASTNRIVVNRVIKTHFHVIRSNDGRSGDVSDAKILESINVLNQAFSSHFTFDFDINTDVTKTDNSAWYNLDADDDATELAMKSAVRRGDCSELNIYSASPLGGVLGWATFPWSCSSNEMNDGVVILDETVPNGNKENYNDGYTLVHEVGHWLGLWHTFQGGCWSTGDEVADTPPEASPASGCPVGRDSCPNQPGVDPIRNFMDYSYDSCMDHFTSGQYARMVSQWDQYRNLVVNPTISSQPSKAKTQNPSSTPSLSLRPSASSMCPSGQGEVEIQIVTDNYGYETSWTLENKCTSTIVYQGPGQGSPYTSRQTITIIKCIPLNQQYSFVIYDSANDGLCCGYGEGSYRLKFKRTLLKSGGSFAGSEETTFGSCQTNVVPLPSSVPSSLPSVKPTVSPSFVPSVIPSRSPSVMASLAPSKSLKPSKSADISEPPSISLIPSLLPSLTPSRSPSLNPSSKPSLSPSLAPSRNPSSSPTSLSSQNPSVSLTPSQSHSLCPSGTTRVQINVKTDTFGSETTWSLTNLCSRKVVLQNSGDYASNQLYTVDECIPSNAEYSFFILDKYGDGICCRFGNGYYDITYNGNVLKQGGAFGYTDSVTFGSCGGTGQDCVDEKEAQVDVEIATDYFGEETSWYLINNCTQNVVMRNEAPLAGFQAYRSKKCIPRDQMYTFVIKDDYGDGICCDNGKGSYKVSFDGSVIKEGGEFGKLETATFGSCDSSPSPSTNFAPTSTPTLSLQPTWAVNTQVGVSTTLRAVSSGGNFQLQQQQAIINNPLNALQQEAFCNAMIANIGLDTIANQVNCQIVSQTLINDHLKLHFVISLSSNDAQMASDAETSIAVRLNDAASLTNVETYLQNSNFGQVTVESSLVNTPSSNPTLSVGPSQIPSKRPSLTPSKSPTKFPTKIPTTNPTKAPTRNPTKSPTKTPTTNPTKAPTRAPTNNPTRAPTNNPTRAPTNNPTRAPTNNPTRAPTNNPTRAPTRNPTRAPTRNPTKAPTKAPTENPTNAPTENPTNAPTENPTNAPTENPTNAPTKAPTRNPTKAPTRNPTNTPTKTPTPPPTTPPIMFENPRCSKIDQVQNKKKKIRACKKASCCIWNKQKGCIADTGCGSGGDPPTPPAPQPASSSGCGSFTKANKCRSSNQHCCKWKKGTCVSQPKCKKCSKMTQQGKKKCTKDGCCEWSGNVCQNKSICPVGRRRKKMNKRKKNKRKAIEKAIEKAI